MVQEGKIEAPFNNLPEDGPLRKLTHYDLPFPLRERFSQSKERPKSKKSKEVDHFSQFFNNSKENIVSQISTLKGFDFSQSFMRDSKKVQLGNNAKKLKAKDKFIFEDTFNGNIVDMNMAMKPISSNHKARR
jgi:hypothetical protein